MDKYSESKKKVIFLELVILMSQVITWKEKVVIQSLRLSLEELELIYVMEDIIHFIGWALG